MALSMFSFVVAFFTALVLTPFWIRKAKSIGLVGKDIHKKKKPLIAEAGGVAVIFSTLLGIFVYIFINTFIIKTDVHLIEILGLTLTFLLAGFIGFIDDILGWKTGLKQFHKFLLSIPIAIPLMVLNAGTSEMALPVFGSIDFGLFYPLFIVPLAIIFVTNAFNMLAGYNGLETGNGVIILTTLAFVIWKTGAFWAAVIALIAAFAITGNAEKVVFILFLPYILEFFLKARGKFQKESFAKLQKNGSLKMPYKKIYSLTHLSLWFLRYFKENRKVYEKDIVYFLWAIEIILALIAIFFI
ncbi:hypothetical protein B6U80_01145 [Candidatus Pacearchaeota archaeon ex4484_26]|nr:MAG: hypothetical protein B6U80_01145 [Candidatus Pacearchaeota archaeon ex4484_26]